MSIGIKAGSIIDEVGTSAFFHAFFSTVSHLLEPSGWGTRFPIIMNELYQGRLIAGKATGAKDELLIIQKELKNHKPSEVVWDIADLKKRPPWGDNISNTITDLSNYFVTSTGRDLINTMIDCFIFAGAKNYDIDIVTY